MSKYAKGDKVVKVNTNASGIIVEVVPPRRGRQLYRVNWGDRITDELEVNLIPDYDIDDPFERCKNGIFGTYSEYSKINTSSKISSSNNSIISSLKSSKTLFRAYQFKPLLKFLNSPNRRLLIADEVGLGKTIEAGHIMLELKARRKLHNVLIICPKSLQDKWKSELELKFGLLFKIYDSAKDLIADIQFQRTSVHAIINYEKIRVKKHSVKAEKGSLIDFLSSNEIKFSLVLCDEAHKLRNNSTQTYKGAEVIMSKADSAVFLTATPVMISTENLYNILHLLDNVRYSNYQIFDNQLQANRPFVEALTDLNHQVSFSAMANKLKGATIYSRYYSNDELVSEEATTIADTFRSDVIYQEIMRMLEGEDTAKSRARLQYLLSSMSVMNSIFSRTRKREVTTDMSQAERKPHRCTVVLTRKEQIEFDKVIEQYIDDNSYTSWIGEATLTQGGALGLVQRKRQIASSVYAYLNSDEDLDKGIDKYAQYPDAKFDTLMQVIDEVFANGTKKIVIFALFRKTLKYLQTRFKSQGLGALLIHGMVENRTEILDEFRSNPNAHILLSSEVGSEGLDMQFCNSMVNYDLPWNPMVVEQRIGRIDRFGQKSPVVNIYNLVVAGSIQEEIYDRLLDRIGIFRGTIGDMEAILDAPLEKGGSISIQTAYYKLEKELYVSKLTEEERARKIAEINLAFANEQENILHLEEELSGTLTNDAYFKDEINRIKNNKAYVTDVELKNFLEQGIRQGMSTCSLVKVSNDVFEFRMPKSSKRVLLNFLEANHPSDNESQVSTRQFKRWIEDKSSFRLTFNQQKAYEDSQLIFVNIYHPIITSCQNYFSRYDNKSKTTFSYALHSDNLLKVGLRYYMVVYQISVKRTLQGVDKSMDTLVPLLYSVDERRIVTDEEIINRTFSRSQTDGVEHNADVSTIDSCMLQDMRYDFAEAISEEKNKMMSEIMLQSQSDRQRYEQSVCEYYKTMIANQGEYINKWRREMYYGDDVSEKRKGELQGIIRLAKDRVQKLESERDDRIQQIREMTLQPEISESIVSLNLITII